MYNSNSYFDFTDIHQLKSIDSTLSDLLFKLAFLNTDFDTDKFYRECVIFKNRINIQLVRLNNN